MSLNPLEIFRRGRSDLSNFLIHLTKNGSYEEYRPFPANPGSHLFGPSATLNAEDSLRKILTNATGPAILARAPFGHFKFNIDVGFKKRGGIPLDWLKCVCFSEAPLRELKSFYTATQDPRNSSLKHNKYQKFGIGFSTEFVRSKKGHPVFYFDSRRDDIVAALDSIPTGESLSHWKPLLPLFEQYGPKLHIQDKREIDFRWEREWRAIGDFTFTFSEVAFGLCPEEKISDFKNLVNNSFPFIDPDWTADKLEQELTANGWGNLAQAL